MSWFPHVFACFMVLGIDPGHYARSAGTDTLHQPRPLADGGVWVLWRLGWSREPILGDGADSLWSQV